MSQRVTSTSPAGRQSSTTLDSLGRVRVVRPPGLDSVVYSYDGRGRLEQVETGGPAASYTYDALGRRQFDGKRIDTLYLYHKRLMMIS